MPATGSASSPPTAAASPRCCAALPARWSRPTGDITRARGLTLGYVEQDVPAACWTAAFHAAVLDALPADQAERKLAGRCRARMLEVPEELRERPLSQLSGGWQRLAMLARVW